MNKAFSFYFDKNKYLWVDVYLYDVHPNTFVKWAKTRWGYWQADCPTCKSGLFGSLHFVKPRLRIDTIRHELCHAHREWMWINRTAWMGKNEEYLIEMEDRLLWRFLRELSKVEPRAKVWMRTLSEL